MGALEAIILLVRGIMMNRTTLALENLALRQQLAVLERSVKRPRLRPHDRIFWICLSRLWKRWRESLMFVQPETVIGWHRKGFKLYWRWKSKNKKPGQPKVERKLRALIRRMSKENPMWGAPRIQSELILLGYTEGESTVSKYIIREKKPPSQTWKTFLENHVDCLASMDFFTVPTATFRVLYCFIVLCHKQRRIVHVNATVNPTQQWTAQQITEAFPYDEAPRYLICDRDSTYGEWFRQHLDDMGIEEMINAPRSPWQKPFVERVIGSIRRECLNWRRASKRGPCEAGGIENRRILHVTTNYSSVS